MKLTGCRWFVYYYNNYGERGVKITTKPTLKGCELVGRSGDIVSALKPGFDDLILIRETCGYLSWNFEMSMSTL